MNKAISRAPAIDGEAAAALMEPLTDLVIRAGAAILAVNRAAMRIDGKLDGSPVTEADLAADRIIAEGLARLVPQVPTLSEERVGLAMPPYDGSFFLIDPLDGTKEFVAGRDEFTVNLALVTNGVPLLGIIGAPALGLVWRGIVGRGAQRLTTGEETGGRADPYPPPAETRRALDRSRQPLASGPPDRSLHRRAARRRQADARLGGQIRPGGGGPGRYLSPSRTDIRVGYRGRTRDRHRRRRQGQGSARRRVAVREGPPGPDGQQDFIVPEFIAWGDPAAV